MRTVSAVRAVSAVSVEYEASIVNYASTVFPVNAGNAASATCFAHDASTSDNAASRVSAIGDC